VFGDAELAPVLKSKVATGLELIREIIRAPEGDTVALPVVEPSVVITTLPPDPVPEPSPAVSQSRTSYVPGVWKIIPLGLDWVTSYEKY
jgi:hypothetical protein